MKFGLPLAALALSACAAGAKPPANLSWLSGYWLSCANGQQVTETWSDMRGGQMLEIGMTTAAGKATWEFSRIGPSTADKSVLAYFTQPPDQPAGEFPLNAAKSTATKPVFENLAHDFPQRVIYARDGGDLTARIEGTIGGKEQTMDWRYKSAPLNQSCRG
jgi:hypothetical protein